MLLRKQKPKLWFLVRLFHPNAEWGNVAFAFGDTIYSNTGLSYEIEAHEHVHLAQMKYSKLWGVVHFIRYTFSRAYRLDSELEAYRHQIRFMKGDRSYVRKIAAQISSKVYGNMITYQEALCALSE